MKLTLRKQLLFIALMSFTLMGDYLFNITLVWNVVKIGGSKAFLGGFLFLVILTPYLLQKAIKKLPIFIANYARQLFTFVRYLGLGISLVAIIFIGSITLTWLYSLAAFFVISAYLNAQILDAMLARKVLNKATSADEASMIQQITMQTCVLIGGGLAGFLLDLGGVKLICIPNLVTFITGALASGYLFLNTAGRPSGTLEAIKKVSLSKDIANQELLWLALAILLLASSNVYTFNFLYPMIIQVDKGWSASIFGLCDSIGGLGAVASAVWVIKKRASWLWRYDFILVAICTMVMSHAPYVALILPAVLLFYWLLTALRIQQREFIYGNMGDHD